MKKFTRIFCAIFVLTLVTYSLAHAATSDGIQTINPADLQKPATTQQAKVVSDVVATVNIVNGKILSQEGRNLTHSFDISNRVGSQPQVEYAA